MRCLKKLLLWMCYYLEQLVSYTHHSSIGFQLSSVSFVTIGLVNPEGYDSLMGLSFSYMLGANRKPRILSESLHIPIKPGGTHGYLVTYEGAKKLLELCPKANYHVDIVVSCV